METIGKVLCFFGWHSFTCKLSDYMEEFGGVPCDGRMPKNAKCNKCGIKYSKKL